MEFKFSAQFKTLRVELLRNEPWFAAKDVCDVLDLGNSREAISRLEDDEKGVITTDTLGGPQKLQFVNESGLYNLIFQSRKPEAKKFRKWVTSEVLPAIRKTGGYGSPSQNLSLLNRDGILEMLDFCEHHNYNGGEYYAVTQLRAFFGKQKTGGNTMALKEMLQTGEAIKLPPDYIGAKWYVKKSAIARMLGIRPTNLINISIIRALKEGGAQ
jgi:hypothetical protein